MGSSAMPHKKNPVLSENLTGLARLIRASVIPALENVALWHERDISHSSVERNIGPDTTVTLDFALNRLNEIVKSMKISSKNMKRNLELTKGLFFSQRVLLELTSKGLKRQVAYKIVQKCAMKSLENNSSFYNTLLKDKKIMGKIPVNTLKKLFDFSYHTRKIDVIFKRILKR
jgi:adenylosuccinate lyase